MPRVLITGASRGVGLALAAEYLGRGWEVVAACRDPDGAKALKALGPERLTLTPLEVTDPAQVAALGRTLAATPLDVLINNAGVFDTDPKLGEVDLAEWRHVLEVNLLAPTRLVEALLPAVRLGGQKKIVTLTSQHGSIELSRGGNYLYRSSKAAVNMVMRSISHDLKDEGIIVSLISPGLVDTDMIRHLQRDKLTPQASAKGVADCIERLTPEQSGLAMRFSGELLPW